MSAPTTITQWLLGLPIRWLVSGPVGSKDASSQGKLYDENVQNLREATLARFPSEAPADALSHIGGDRKLIQGIPETDSNFRIRLKTAWGDWARAGTPAELLAQLFWEGFISQIVQQNGLGHSLFSDPVAGEDIQTTTIKFGALAAPLTGDRPGDPTIPISSLQPNGFGAVTSQPTPWWLFDNHTAFCSRFSVVIFTLPLAITITTGGLLGVAEFTYQVAGNPTYGPFKTTAAGFNFDFGGTLYNLAFSSSTYVNGSTWTLNADETITTGGGWAGTLTPTYPSQNLLSRLRVLIDTWKPAKASLVRIIDIHNGFAWGFPNSLEWGIGGIKWGTPTPLFYYYGP